MLSTITPATEADVTNILYQQYLVNKYLLIICNQDEDHTHLIPERLVPRQIHRAVTTQHVNQFQGRWVDHKNPKVFAEISHL